MFSVTISGVSLYFQFFSRVSLPLSARNICTVKPPVSTARLIGFFSVSFMSLLGMASKEERSRVPVFPEISPGSES